VTEFDGIKSFKVGIAPETLRRTNLGQLRVGSKVNLERAVQGHVRFGGHFVQVLPHTSLLLFTAESVQGHVDTTAEIVVAARDGNAVAMTFKPSDPKVLMYIVEKGYIALDGTSLTITAVDDTTFSVMLIAYTQAPTVVAMKEVGDQVNVEVDLLGKLVEKQVLGALQGSHDGQGSLVEKIVRRVLNK
jgi:riboflavin synthase